MTATIQTKVLRELDDRLVAALPMHFRRQDNKGTSRRVNHVVSEWLNGRACPNGAVADVAEKADGAPAPVPAVAIDGDGCAASPAAGAERQSDNVKGRKGDTGVRPKP